MVNTVALARRRLTTKSAAWAFWAANLLVILYFWTLDGLPEVFSGDVVAALHAVGRLFGLLATFCVLVQFMLMGRVGWLEPIFGLDRLALFHRYNGGVAITLISLHIPLMIITHPLLQGSTDFFGVFNLPYIWLALFGALCLYTTVGTSIYIVRKRLKFEWWWTVHLLNYAAILLIFWHQIANGGDLLASQVFRDYWIALYIFVIIHVLTWRFGTTLYLYLKHDFTVQKVVKETPTATSVYITGKRLDTFHAKGGQFIMVRFFDKKFIWQEHPFSLSRLPNSQNLRLTIRQLGDYTNMIPQLKAGSAVWVSGPFGSFTYQKQRTNKILYIAGGIGITPIRSMIENQAQRGEKNNAVLLYGNRTEADTIFLNELAKLAQQTGLTMHNVLSEQKGYKGENGYIDKEKIARLVPDVAERDIFLCGPPPMMWGIIDILRELGVPKEYIHYERFSLYKKG